jgi:heterotetrameric sarcosine oxidase gamma subunit
MADGTPAPSGTVELPLARSPISPAPPRQRHGAWEVSGRRSSAALRLADLTALAKVQVRSQSGGYVSERMSVTFGRAQRDGSGNLVVGEGPGEWLVLGPSGQERDVLAALDGIGAGTFATAIDLTHGYALVRLTGNEASAVLSKLCPIDLSARTTPDGTSFRTGLAGLVVTILRDDVDGEPSYLCYCERSSGQYLFDTLMDAGNEFGVDVDGYPDKEI